MNQALLVGLIAWCVAYLAFRMIQHLTQGPMHGI